MSKLSEIKLSVNYEDFLLKLKNFSENKSKGYCCLVNPSILINCYKNESYFKTIQSAAFNVCDAISIEIINNLIKKIKIKSSLGPDIFKDITKKNDYSQFFIGGKNEILLDTLRRKLGYLKVDKKDFYCPPFLDVDDLIYF